VSRINWSMCVLTPNRTVRDAIDNLIASSKRIVLVVSQEGIFEGTVSDGDIRRGLLRGISLQSQLSEIIQRSAIIASPETSRDTVKSLMLTHKIQQIPIVDKFKKLHGLHEWDELDLSPLRENLFVVMAGGEGKRLMPHTLNTPKPMVLVHGKPMLEHILVRAKANGFRNFVLVVHHMSQMIEDYFSDGSKWEVSIRYISEEKPLGTAGGLAQLPGLGKEPVVVTNGDVLSDLNYSEILDFHLENNASGTMAVRQHELAHPFGVVNLEGLRITSIEEKPVLRNYINAGVYVISREAISTLDQGAFMNMTDFFATLLSHEENVCAYPIHESWIDVGRPEDLKEVATKFRENKV
jgi:dTDP-glucose pyrophosphorylase